MKIQWYPGHMFKACKEIQHVLPDIDVLIEILDARLPFSSQNPVLQQLRGNKPTIRVLNKSDLADPQITRQWLEYLELQQGVKAMPLTSRQPEKVKQISALCVDILADKARANRRMTAMIMGIPNVGKSTIINVLAGRSVAKTGNEPAVTKMQQRIPLPGNLTLSDTPGVLWPNLENRNSGYRLAASGAIKDTAYQYDDVALFAIEYLTQAYPERLKQRYQLSELDADALTVLQQIGQKRGCLAGGKRVDFDKAGRLLLNELRSGALGAITLETPQMIEAELVALEQNRAQKQEQNARRKRSKAMKLFSSDAESS
jgi:ribosome biogenesis GTPase A